jgi:uncharacterized protein (TIGR02453 family)
MTISKSVFTFLNGIKKNPTKTWMEEHKSEYKSAKAEFEDFVGELVPHVAQFDETITGVENVKIFRIYRDVRFSKDKTPYKHHFGAFISPKADVGAMSGYYLHIEPGATFVGGGMYGIEDSKSLFALRSYISNNLSDFEKVLKHKDFQKYYGELGSFDSDLKTAPKGFSKDDPALKYIRKKHYTGSNNMTDKEVLADNFLKELVKRYKALHPFNTFLNTGVSKG